MKKLVVLLIISIFMFGCAGVGKQKAETKEAPHTGTKGITATFLANAPPTTMYVESGTTQVPYQIVLSLKNEGTYTIDPSIYLLGFDTNIFTNLDNSANSAGSLEGRSAQNPEGGFAQFAKDIGSINLPPGTDTLSFNLLVALCYPYETQASLPVCIDPDPYGVVVAKACTPHGVPTGGGQGAPVAISAVTQESLPNKAIFKITVSNSGGGQVYDMGAINCLDIRYSEVDKVNYYDVTLGTNIQGECSPLSPLTLTNGRAVMTCIFDIPQNQAFTTSLNIKLKYGYTNTIQKPLNVKRI